MLSSPRSRAAVGVLCLLLAVTSLFLLMLPAGIIPTLSKSKEDSPADKIVLPQFSPVSLSIGGLSAQSAVLIDADSGLVLYEQKADVPLPMASTTKIMTALCAVDLADVDTLITVDRRAVGVEGSSIYLKEGEQLPLLDLLYALLLASANDAAAAIAIGTAGSIEAFAAYMNQKADDLGLTNTSFENPHGLDAEEHYTTAHDLALIARQLLRHPLLKTIVSTKKICLSPTNLCDGRVLVNHNKLLRTYEGAIGVKTGYTKRSGRCLVSAAEQDGLTLIAVTLNAPDDWQDHTRLLDAGFETYESRTLCATDEFCSLLPVVSGKEDYVLVRNREALRVTLPRRDIDIDCQIELPRFTYAGVAAGQSMGRLIFWGDVDQDDQKEIIASVDLCALYSVPVREKQSIWRRIFGK